jgi:hypothetical protein
MTATDRLYGRPIPRPPRISAWVLAFLAAIR